jgi:hypothetical protein
MAAVLKRDRQPEGVINSAGLSAGRGAWMSLRVPPARSVVALLSLLLSSLLIRSQIPVVQRRSQLSDKPARAAYGP